MADPILDVDSKLVSAVERAAAAAWVQIPKPPHHACVPLVPPTDAHVLSGFVVNAAAWLAENATDLVAHTRAVRGKVANHPHVWLELTLVGGDPESPRVVCADISTPPNCDTYLVASDDTISAAKSARRSMYYRRISICFGDGSDVFVGGDLVHGVDLAAAVDPTTPFGIAFRAVQNASEVGLQVLSRAHVVAFTRFFAAPGSEEAALTDKGCFIYARVLCDALGVVLRHVFGDRWDQHEANANLDALDSAWYVVFGMKNIWGRNRDALRVLSTLSSNEAHQIDAVSIAYQCAKNAVSEVVRLTEERILALAASGPRFVVPMTRTPGHDFLLRVFGLTCNSQHTSLKHSNLIRERYPHDIAYMLECIADTSLYSRVHDDEGYTRMLREFNAIQECWPPGNADSQRDWHIFFTCARQFMRLSVSDIRVFQKLLNAWATVDKKYLLPEPERKPQPVAVVLPMLSEPSPVETPEPVATHARIAFRYDVTASPVCLCIDVTTAMSTQPEKEWTAVRTLSDLMHTEWMMHTEFSREDVASGGMYAFMASLGLTTTPKFRMVDIVWLVAVIPPASRGPAGSSAWARDLVPYIIGPLIDFLCVESPRENPWEAYKEQVRRAVQVLKTTVEVQLRFFALKCPGEFLVPDFDPTAHEIDQWLSYFHEMPFVTRDFLDAQRRRYNASFTLQRGADGDVPTVITRVVIRPPPPSIKIDFAKAVNSSYDKALAAAVGLWFDEKNGSQQAGVDVPLSVLRDNVVSAIKNHRCVIKADHISEDMPHFARLIQTSFHVGMLFGIRRKQALELEFHRDVTHYFELAYTKSLTALRDAVAAGELSNNASTTLFMEISPGYLAEGVESARTHVSTTLVIRPGEWQPDTLSFLRGWARVHLQRAVESSLVTLRVTPERIEFLPSVQLVCRVRCVYFLVTAYLTNPIDMRNESYVVPAVPSFDPKQGVCSIDLGETVANWFAARVLSYEAAAGDRVRVAPYTRVTGKVYLCARDARPLMISSFVADSNVCNFVRGDAFSIECEPRDVHKDTTFMIAAYMERHRAVTFSIMNRSGAVPDTQEVSRALISLAAYKFYESFKGLPLYVELENRMQPEEYPQCVVREYYRNEHVHPRVKRITCSIGIARFTTALYGRDNAFLSTIQ